MNRLQSCIAELITCPFRDRSSKESHIVSEKLRQEFFVKSNFCIIIKYYLVEFTVGIKKHNGVYHLK